MMGKRIIMAIPIAFAMMILFLIAMHPSNDPIFTGICWAMLGFVMLLGFITYRRIRLIESVQKKLRELSDISEHLYNALVALRNSSQQMAGSSSRMAGMVIEHEKSISESKEVMGNLSASIKENFDVVGEAAEGVLSARQESKRGEEHAQDARTMLGQINEDVDKSKALAESLMAKSRAIENIVNLITQISEQTKLLALNAAIEASRAGDAGRGFEVVADEIRKLSEETGLSVKKVSQLIEEISKSTEAVVNSMVKSSQEVGLGSKVINEALEALQRISRSTAESTAFVENVYSMFEQQIAGTKSVSSSLDQLYAVSKKNRESIQSVSNGLHESSSLINQLEENAKQLADVSKALEKKLK
jgi:methyl-accepting chemotaxis protein